MIEIKINEAAITAALTRAVAQLGDLTEVMQDIGELLLNSTKQRFRESKAPDGSAWAANSPTTLARKKGTLPLIGETGQLAQQFSVEATATSVEIGTNKVQAAMMQFGGTKAKFPHLWGDIPARPFLGLSAQDEQDILDTITEALERSMQP